MKLLTFLLSLFISTIIIASTEFKEVHTTDTIVQPPNFPSLISGAVNPCIGDTIAYSTDIPVSCQANWYIDGILQNFTTGILEVIWTESGSFMITLDFECDTNIYSTDTLMVDIASLPNIPNPITGETNVCASSTTIYTTEVSEGEQCQWIVDGIIQLSDSSYLSYYWVELGMHNIEVRAINDCGISVAEYLAVEVFELPIVNLGNDTTIIQGQSIELNAGNPGAIYLWSTEETTQSIIVSQSDNYNVTVSNACGYIWDEINVAVIVSVNELAKSTELVTSITGNNISIKARGIVIKKVQIWDIAGRLIINSTPKHYYYLPQKGLYFIVAMAEGGNVFKCRIIK